MPKIKTAIFLPQNKLRHCLLLLILMGIMFFIRTAPLYQQIFTNWPGEFGNYVNFSADDAVYHMRLVHNTLHHFFERIFFDPFTHFPYGNQIHFGPLFTLIIAAIALVAGLGQPTPELTNLISAYIPVIMGLLCLIPLYFIGRTLINSKAALLSAFILAFLPGEFLQRSALGFVDHHVAEVLFSTATCAFFIAALRSAIIPLRQKFFVRQAIYAGIFFGLFILIWPAALLFGAIFLLFLITQLILTQSKQQDPKYLLKLAIPLYSIPMIMVLPYSLLNPKLELGYYSLTQPTILLGILLLFSFVYLLQASYRKYGPSRILSYLVVLVFFALIAFIFSQQLSQIGMIISAGYKMLFQPTSGMRTVSEVQSAMFSPESGKLTIATFWYSYFWALPLALLGFGYLSYRVYKNGRPQELFLLIWSMIIFAATCAQCRFNYYLAINVAILGGCYSFYPLLVWLRRLKAKKLWLNSLFVVLVVLLVDPILMLLMDKNIPSGVQVTKEWYDTYLWLKTHTPDPQGKNISKDFDYVKGYYQIPRDPKQPYPYPESAYGVMAWWDIGHQLTYIAKRIPNSNPFQQGVIEKDLTVGAAPFFISTDEKQAIKILKESGSRYIVIDQKTATNIATLGVWCNDTSGWTVKTKIQVTLPEKNIGLKASKDSAKFQRSLLNRLFYRDTDGLQHFRLIHESAGDYFVIIRRVLFKPKLHPDLMVLYFKNYDSAETIVNSVNQGFWANQERTILAYQARPASKKIKIFEKVKGAVITGTVSPQIPKNSKIYLTLKLKTKFNRIITYQQVTKIRGHHFEFTVPYPTTLMQGSDYSYDIKPLGKYQLQVGSQAIEVFVPEAAVLSGEKIRVKIT